jgi:hemoglobin-like flavoprotein
MHQVRNMLMINVFEPIKDKLDSEVTKFAYWAKDKITYPFRLAFGPIIDSMKDFKDDIGDFVKAKFEKLTDGIGEVLHTGLKKIFEPFTSLIGRIGKGLIGGVSSATKMALSPVTGALGLASFMVGGKRSRDKAAFLKSTVKNEYGILRDKWANDEANATDTSLGARARRMAGRFGDIRKAYQTGRQAWNDRMTAEGRNSLNWRGVKDERKQDKLDLKDEKTTEKMWSKINKLRKGYMERDNFKEVYWSDKTADEMRKKFIASGVDENWIKTNDDLRDLIYDREKWKDKWNPNKPNNSTTSVMNIEETPEQRAAREATMAHQNIVEKWLADIYDVMAEAAGVYSGSDRRKEGDKEVKRARRALKRRHMSVDDLGLSDDELKDYADMPAYEFDNYRNSEYYETKDFRGWYNANVGRFGKFNEYPSSEAGFSDSSNNTTNSSKTPTEAIINMSRTINDNLETQNKISTGIVEAATGGAWDSDKMQISDQQAAEAHTSTAELAKAQEKGILNGLTSLWKKKSKQSKRDAQLAAEASESAAAQSMNTLDTADIAVLSGEGDGNEETDKVQGKSTGFLGKVGNFFNWFTSSGNWIKLLAGAGISYLFKDQILSISEALPELVTKYAPKIQGAISKFIDKYGAPIIEAATSTITSLMPSLIKSAFSITQSLFSNLFTSIKTSLGFGDDSSTVSADQATSLDAAGINYITNGDGTLTVPGSRTVFNEDGSMSSVSNTGLQSATFKLARNMITNKNTAKAVARIAGKSVGAIGKIVTAPLRLVPGGKVAANMVSSAAGIATNAAVNAGGKAASVIKTAATSTTF